MSGTLAGTLASSSAWSLWYKHEFPHSGRQRASWAFLGGSLPARHMQSCVN